MLIQILVDNPKSWIVPYSQKLKTELENKGFLCKLIHQHNDIEKGDILILLSCEKILENLTLNKYNLVVHESELPKGKGWSPLTWQILEGKNKIPVTLFQANEKVDSGVIYGHVIIELDGTELVDDLREKQANATRELLLNFLAAYPTVKGKEPEGEESFYLRRKPEHSQLDINKTIAEQFNLLRVCDNERYPAFFLIKGVKYTLKIFKEDETLSN
ncbi:MAG: formyltransferase family protein [Bacteroidota bacterium]